MTNAEHHVNMTERLDTMQHNAQSSAAQLAWVVAKIVVTLFISATITMATGYVRDMRDDLRLVSNKVEQQGTQTLLQQQSLNGQQKVTDAAVLALQALGKQVDHNTYDIGTLKAAADYNVKRTRP